MQGAQIWRNKAREASYRPRAQQRLPHVLRRGNGGVLIVGEEKSQAEKMEMEVRIVGGRVLWEREDATLAS